MRPEDPAFWDSTFAEKLTCTIDIVKIVFLLSGKIVMLFHLQKLEALRCNSKNASAAETVKIGLELLTARHYP